MTHSTNFQRLVFNRRELCHQRNLKLLRARKLQSLFIQASGLQFSPIGLRNVFTDMRPSPFFIPCSMIGAFPGKLPSEAPTWNPSESRSIPGDLLSLCSGNHRSRKACYALVMIYCLSELQKKLIALYMKSTLHFNSQCSTVADVIDAMETILSPSLEDSILTNTSSAP